MEGGWGHGGFRGNGMGKRNLGSCRDLWWGREERGSERGRVCCLCEGEEKVWA